MTYATPKLHPDSNEFLCCLADRVDRRSGHVACPRLCSISSSCVRQACCPRSRASDVGPRGGARRGPETSLAEDAPMDREVSGGL